jgi:hypothetical protein
MVLAQASVLGVSPIGSDAYMYGHWWACEPCWSALLEAGVQNLYVIDDAHERFSRDRVYEETLSPSIKTVSLEGFEEDMLNQARDMVTKLHLEIKETEADVRCVYTPAGVNCFLKGEDRPIYFILPNDKLVPQLRNVLRQL